MNRVKAVDIAKGTSVLMLATIHTLWMYGDPNTQENTWVGQTIHFIGRGTPFFLLAMGFALPLSRYQNNNLICKRAFHLLKEGYIMNFLKFLVPVILGFAPANFIAAYGVEDPVSGSFLLYLLQTGDILQLAGVSLLLLAIFNKYALKNKYIPLGLALLILSTTNLVRGVHLGITGVDYVLDLLWGGGWNVYFPVFPWFSFILIGMFFGLWFKEVDRNEQFIFNRMLISGIVFLTIGALLCKYNYDYHFGDFFHLGPGGTLFLAGVTLPFFWLAHLLVTKVKHNFVFEFLYYSSKHVTRLYITQWVLICWGMSIVGFQTLDAIGVLIAIPIMTFLFYFIHALMLRFTNWRKSHFGKQISTIKG